MKPRSIGWLRLVNLLVAAAVLAFVLLSVDLGAASSQLGHARAADLGLVVLLNLPFALLFWARSRLVLSRLGYKVPWHVLLPVSVLGNVAGTLTPAAAGEFLRATALKRTAQVAIDDGVALILYERGVSIYLFALSAAACLALASLSLAPALATCLLCLALVALPWVAAVAVLPRLPKAASVEGVGVARRLLRYALGLSERLRFLLHDAGLLARWSGLTLLIFALMALQLYLLVHSLAADISLPQAWVAIAGTGLAIIVSLLPLGLGIGDGSLAAILTRMGLDLERAAAVAVLLRATSTLPLLAMASASYLSLGRHAVEDRPAKPDPAAR